MDTVCVPSPVCDVNIYRYNKNSPWNVQLVDKKRTSTTAVHAYEFIYERSYHKKNDLELFQEINELRSNGLQIPTSAVSKILHFLNKVPVIRDSANPNLDESVNDW